jgi:DNA-binding PucR family transcriptional regulator
MTYRLKSIEKLVDMHLDDPCERLHILLSCIALRILA